MTAFELARATAIAARLGLARLPTVHTRMINIDYRIAAAGRQPMLHFPRD